MTYRIGIDLGGTNIVCGLVNPQDEVTDHYREPTTALRGSEELLHTIARMTQHLIDRNGLRSTEIACVGAGIPGYVNPESGIGTGSTNLRWPQANVAEQLVQLLNLPVYIDNDVRMYVLGEALFGAGKLYSSILGITLGTGVGAALVCDRSLFYGSQLIAAEIGHIQIDGETALCGCGKRGCLETVASARGLVRQAQQFLTEGRASLLAEIAADPALLTAADLSYAYDQGDHLAIEIMHHSGRVLGKAISYAVICYDPAVIVIGGGVSAAGDRLLDAVRAEMMERVLRRHNDLEIRLAKLGDNAGILGSAANASRRWKQEQANKP